MPITVTATSVGATTPKQAQVEVNGIAVDDTVLIEGIVGGFTWTVRGGDQVSTSTQIVLRDALVPINVAVTYRATVNGVQYEADPLTVTYTADYVLTNLEGGDATGVQWVATPDPVTVQPNQHLSFVNGRRRAVLRYAQGGSESGVWQFTTDGDATESLRSLIAASAPAVMRTNGGIGDMLPIRLVAFGTSVRSLVAPGQSDLRLWECPWTEVDDPYADTAATGALFSHINTVLDAQGGGGLFSDFNTFVSTLDDTTFADVNRYDWEQEAS